MTRTQSGTSPQHRPAASGSGVAADERAARAQGRNTVRRLMAAGRAEFGERGFAVVTVDDIVGRAQMSHGTFYLYFANKDDFFEALSQEALLAMENVADEFPVLTSASAGREALDRWVRLFCRTYAAHAVVFRIMSQADHVCPAAWANGLKLLTRLAEVVGLGMTAGRTGAAHSGVPVPASSAQLDALACVLMLERVNYLVSAGVQVSEDEITDRLTAIILAAFQAGSGAAADDGAPPRDRPRRPSA